ncbi:primosomal replication protein [Thalassotalea atypica]|uniref:primosomal replication protein n=1 Tax=Thalassotalea atypica TaxID=2054316 RepID=UPI002574546E|nr:primosomal replication protein [Thalassotalea atypica]
MVLNKHQKAIARLHSIITELAKQALQIDQENSQLKSHRRIEDKALFSSNLFSTQSDKYHLYVKEIERKVKELQKHISYENFTVVDNLLPSLERQIAAITTALSANDSIHRNIDNAFKPRQFIKNKYKKTAKLIMQPTHELYSKLSEHNEFERRLALMIAEREMLRSKTSNHSANNEKLKLEILALHQRLGRCRQAISIIERDIELAEKRGSKPNR